MPDPDYGIVGTTPGTGAPAEQRPGTGAEGIVGTTPATGAAPVSRGHLLDNEGTNDPNGFAKNTATGAIRMGMHAPGFLGDAIEMGHFLGSNVASIMPGERRTAKDIREHHARNNALDRDLLASTHGPTSTGRRAVGSTLNALNPSSGSELYEKYVEPRLGEYKPETLIGRIYQGGLEGALPIPAGKAKVVSSAAGAAPGVFAHALDIARRATTSSAGTGALMGATATGVGEILGPGAGIAASLLVPYGTKKLGPRPTTYDKASDKLHGSLHDPINAMHELETVAPAGYRDTAGSPLNLAEATRDKNIAGVTKGHENVHEDFGANLNDLRGQQAQNRQTQLQGMGRGNSGAVSETARAMRDDIHAKADADTATQQRLAEMLAGPEATAKDVTGKQAIDIRDTNNDRARAAVTKLYRGIDPNNNIHVDLSSVKTMGADILGSLDPRKHLPSPEAEAVLKMAKDLPPTWGFNDLVEFDKTVGQARWKASKAGDAHGAGILKKLQDHIDEVRDGSLDRRAAWEREAVQRGELKPEQTIEAALERQRAAADIAGAGRRNVAAGAGSSQPVPAGPSAASVGERAGPAPAHPAGAADVPGGVLNPDELAAAAARQDLAKQGHALRKRTFEEGPVGAFPEGDKTLYGNVPASAFAAGPTGAQKLRSWLVAGAGNPEMLESVKRMALTELHGMMEDGAVTTKTLEKWKTKYGSALSEIDRREPGFSKSFDANAAQHQKLLDTTAAGHEAKTTFAKSEAAKLLNMEHPHEVDAHVGRLMSSKTGAPHLRALMEQVAGHPEAKEGIRAAAVEWLKDNATSRELISGSKGSRVNASAPGNYLKALENAQPHMEAVFGKEGFDAAKRVAEEMKRTKEAIDARIVRGGSDTVKNRTRASNAQGLVNYLNEAGGPARLNMAESVAVMEALRGLGEGMLAGDVVRGVLHAAGFLTVRQGLHMLSARTAAQEGKGLRESGDLIRKALLDPAAGHEMLKHGAARANAESRAAPWTVANLRGSETAAAETQRTDDSVGPPQLPAILGMFERQTRAAGGSVGAIDHARHASRMVRMVAKVRDELGRETKPLLNVHDNAIASALANARSMAS